MRFLLPIEPRHIRLRGAAAVLEDAFRELRIETVTSRSHGGVDRTPVDAVFGESADFIATDFETASAIISIDGRAPELPIGWERRDYLRAGPPDRPTLFIDTSRRVRTYVARRWSRPTSRRARLRNRAIASPAFRFASKLTVAGTAPLIPYPLQVAATAAKLPATGTCFLQLGSGDDLQRVVMQAFDPTRPQPTWVTKFSRVSGAPDRSDREFRVLAHLRDSGPNVEQHLPRLLAQFPLHDSQAIVESAAPGTVLTAHLRAAGSNNARAMYEAALQWAIDLSVTTKQVRTNEVDGELSQLLEEWGGSGIRSRLTEVPQCVAHNDLGTWNIQTDGRTFTVVDWESASIAGLPIGDVAYLVSDALAVLYGPEDDDERAQWCCQLWRGDLDVSQVAFEWLARAANALGISVDAASALVTVSWLRHGLSQERRATFLSGKEANEGYLGKVSSYWMNDSKLGFDWVAYAS